VNTILCKAITPEQAAQLNPALPVWFDPLWMQSVSELFGITPKVLVCSKNDNPVAFLPLYEKKFLTLIQAYNPTLVYYCPLLFTYPERKQANREMLLEYDITKALGDYLLRHYKRVLLNLNPGQTDMRGFKDARLKVVPQYTFVRDLQAGQDFFIGEMAKLRRAELEGYTCEPDFQPERLLELVYGMYARKRHPFPDDRKGLLKLMKSLQGKGLIEQYNVLKNGIIVSSILIIVDRDKAAYGWLTASDAEEMKRGASLVLFWQLFKTLAERFETFDLCGANSKGPSRLKAAMGADLQLFFQIIK
jgi:hypothetical protein